MIALGLRCTSPRSMLSLGSLRSSRQIQRYIQTTPNHEAEAYLQEARPGIAYLALNRPKAKNAISLRLLKVRGVLLYN